MKILITICARGGSKGIPGKNIKPINGIPLIAYSIKTALEFADIYNADVALSTDDILIKNTAGKHGLSSKYIRPYHLSTDTAGKIAVIKDILAFEEMRKGLSYDYVLDLDVTSPLRTIKDLEDAFKIIQADKDAVNLFSVSPAARNPYFNMVERKEDGYYSVVKKFEGVYLSRQSAPKVFDINGSFYFYNKKFFENNYNSATTDKSLVYVMPHLCFDLDERHDFEFMEFLIQNNKLDFSLG